MLMAPSYINVLNVYAVRNLKFCSLLSGLTLLILQFANVHDISWGTKGDNVVFFGTVATGESGEVVAVVPDEKDMNELYEDSLHVLQTKKPKEEQKVNSGQDQEDYYRNVRTK
jgi:chitin synthase